MARTTHRRTAEKTVRPPRKRISRPSRAARFSVVRLVTISTLLLLLLASLAVAGYAIFFRVALAQELPAASLSPPAFEEPDLPVHHTVVPTGDTKHLSPVRVAIIIDDMGYHPLIGRKLLGLDVNLSFSFLPYAPYTEELEQEAYLRKRTILLHLPLEANNPAYDSGPGTLSLRQSRAERGEIFAGNLRQVPHAVGVNNHMGSRYTQDETAMADLVEELAKRKLFFIDSVTIAASKGAAVARKHGVPTARRDVFLDNVQDTAAICERLEQLVTLARWQGEAIGIGHPYPETLAALVGCGAALLRQVSVVGVETMVEGYRP